MENDVISRLWDYQDSDHAVSYTKIKEKLKFFAQLSTYDLNIVINYIKKNFLT